MVFVSSINLFSDNTRVRIFFFFPEFNIRLYDKNSESDYFLLPPPKSEYFFQQHWESEYFFKKKKLNGRSLTREVCKYFKYFLSLRYQHKTVQHRL